MSSILGVQAKRVSENVFRQANSSAMGREAMVFHPHPSPLPETCDAH